MGLKATIGHSESVLDPRSANLGLFVVFPSNLFFLDHFYDGSINLGPTLILS